MPHKNKNPNNNKHQIVYMHYLKQKQKKIEIIMLQQKHLQMLLKFKVLHKNKLMHFYNNMKQIMLLLNNVKVMSLHLMNKMIQQRKCISFFLLMNIAIFQIQIFVSKKKTIAFFV
eukprot:UN02623